MYIYTIYTIYIYYIYTSLYDKRDDFPFSIVRMPYLDSNIPSKIFYSAYGAEILRSARVTNNKINFEHHCKILVQRMLKQGGRRLTINKTLTKVFGRHFTSFSKFYSTSLNFCEAVLA